MVAAKLGNMDCADRARSSLERMYDVRALAMPENGREGGAAKGILYSLLAHREMKYNKNGALVSDVTRPSIEQIARGAGVSRATVIRTLPYLEECGLIRRHQRSRREATEYEWLVPARTASGPGAERSHSATSEASQSATAQNATPEPPRSQTATSQSAGRAVAECTPSGCRVSLSEDLSEDFSEDPPSPPRENLAPSKRADAVEGSSGTSSGATTVSSAPSVPGKRPPRPYYVRKEDEAHTKQAFEEGVSSVTGVPYVVARADLSALDDAIDGHAPTNTGDACDAWIRESAAAFARAIRTRERYHRQGSPRGWLEWLNQKSPTAEWLAMTPAQRDEHEAEERRRALAKERKQRRDPHENPGQETRATAETRVTAAERESALARAFGPFGGIAVSPAASRSRNAPPDVPAERWADIAEGAA